MANLRSLLAPAYPAARPPWTAGTDGGRAGGRTGAPLGRPIAPRRAVWGGWIAADAHAVVVHRTGNADLRLPHTAIRQLWLEGRNLALIADDGLSLYLPLLTLRRHADRRFVQAVERAAGHRSGGASTGRRTRRGRRRW